MTLGLAQYSVTHVSEIKTQAMPGKRSAVRVASQASWGAASPENQTDETFLKAIGYKRPLGLPFFEESYPPMDSIFELGNKPRSTLSAENTGQNRTKFVQTFYPGSFSAGGGLLELNYTLVSCEGSAVSWQPRKITMQVDISPTIRFVGNALLKKVVDYLPAQGGTVNRAINQVFRQLLFVPESIGQIYVYVDIEWPEGFGIDWLFMWNMTCTVTRTKLTFNPLESAWLPSPGNLGEEQLCWSQSSRTTTTSTDDDDDWLKVKEHKTPE
nr:MAG: hypothetical protein [Solemoviridae sp.]